MHQEPAPWTEVPPFVPRFPFDRDTKSSGKGEEIGIFDFAQHSRHERFGLAMGSYLFLQVSPKIVPDALGTTVLTVGGGGLVVAIAAIFKDYWAYKKAQVDSAERQAKEDRESRERIEMQRLGIDRLRITQSKNNRLTTKMLEWMELAHETQTFPPPPPRVNLTEETEERPA
jgi:tRNA(Met) C34 N-acetyltransferase TmcA